MSFNIDYSFLLNCYKPEDIDVIIDDYAALNKGMRFFYVMDTYDILENYFPYTDKILFSKETMGVKAHKYLCYDYFFGRHNNTDAILLDEYKVELLSAKKKISKTLQEAYSVMKNISSLEQETKGFMEDREKVQEFFNKHMEIIMLILILSKKRDTIFDEFYLFLSDRLNISGVRSMDPEESDRLVGIFNKCRPTETSIDVFQQYARQNEMKVRLLSMKDPHQRNSYLENTYRDIQAVERVVKINQEIEIKGLNYKVIYFSSANKTADIFKCYNKVAEENSPVIYRNIYQYFLLGSIRKEYGDNRVEGEKILHSFKELIQRKLDEGTIKNTLSDNKGLDTFMNTVKVLFDEGAHSVDNHFYLNMYDQYRRVYDLEDSDDRKILNIIRDIDKNKSLYKDGLHRLDYSLSQLNQTYKIIDTYQRFDDYNPVYKYGKDIIRDPFHHLPYLLLVDDGFHPEIRSDLYEFLNSAAVLARPDKFKIRKLLQTMVNKVSRLDLKKVNNKLFRDLLIAYLNFIAQSRENEEEKEQLEGEILLDFEKQFEIARSQFIGPDQEKSVAEKALKYKEVANRFTTEIGYLLIWAYRRNKKTAKAIEIGERLLETNPDDPRIIQGIALAHTARIYEKKDTSDKGIILQEIKQTINYLLSARRIYLEWYQGKYKDDKLSHIILKNFIAICNLLADLHARLYDLDKANHPVALQIARNYIDEVFNHFPRTGFKYERSVTYNSTECEIESYEAIVLKEQNRKEEALATIDRAIDRAEKVRSLPFQEMQMAEPFRKKLDQLEEIRNRILQEETVAP